MLVMHSMELRDLLTFVAVAEAGSLRVAAERLHVSQPAVTRRIQTLERTVGLELLDHRTRPITLTPAGRAFLERSQRAITVLGELKGAAQPERETDLECRIGMPASLADLVLPGLAVTMAEEFPRLRVHFSIAWSDALVRDLQSGTVDAAIVYAPDSGQCLPNLIGEHLAQLPVSIVESRRRPRTRGSMQLAQLSTQRWVMNPEGCCFRSILNKMLDPRRTSAQMILEVIGFKRQLSVVAQGLGLGFVPEPVLLRSPLSSRLRAVPFEDRAVRIPVWMMRRSGGSIAESEISWATADIRRRLRPFEQPPSAAKKAASR
jgi:DNA-binding transcriptional LysR family regulator